MRGPPFGQPKENRQSGAGRREHSDHVLNEPPAPAGVAEKRVQVFAPQHRYNLASRYEAPNRPGDRDPAWVTGSARRIRVDQFALFAIAFVLDRRRRRSQVAKAADCKSAIVGSTPTGASFFAAPGAAHWHPASRPERILGSRTVCIEAFPAHWGRVAGQDDHVAGGPPGPGEFVDLNANGRHVSRFFLR